MQKLINKSTLTTTCKLKLYIATSLDGKIARKNHSFDFLPSIDSEDYGYDEFYNSIDTIVMGYKSYEVCEKFEVWPYKDKTNYVFSRDKSRKLIKEATLVNEDPVEFVSQLKVTNNNKDIWLLGGGELISQLHNADLIDEYIITVIPIILGEGIELFKSTLSKETSLILKNCKSYSSGTILMHYVKKQSTEIENNCKL